MGYDHLFILIYQGELLSFFVTQLRIFPSLQYHQGFLGEGLAIDQMNSKGGVHLKMTFDCLMTDFHNLMYSGPKGYQNAFSNRMHVLENSDMGALNLIFILSKTVILFQLAYGH